MTALERATNALKDEAERLYQQRISSELRDFMAGREDEGWACLVRAVLTAIREPSEGMLSAGGPMTYPEGCDDGHSAAAGTWQAMIDAALAEEGR